MPVRYLDLDAADAHLLALADNRLGEIAEWDDENLREVLREFQAEDMDLEVAGFEADELEALLTEVEGSEPTGGEDPGAEEPTREPRQQAA